MSSGPEFRSDLYRGTARFYDEFRPAYPQPLLDDLRVRARTTGAGRLLDLACGTGQITFGLGSDFVEIWAVDQEPEAVEFAVRKRSAAASTTFAGSRACRGRRSGRLLRARRHRERVPPLAATSRRRVSDALARSGWSSCAALEQPAVDGSHEWQRVLADTVGHWTRAAAATERVPANLDQHLAEEPHTTVLEAAGFTIVGEFEFATPHEWTVEELTGFMYSTSVLSQPALGRNVQAFERDVSARGCWQWSPTGSSARRSVSVTRWQDVRSQPRGRRASVDFSDRWRLDVHLLAQAR